MDMKLEVVVIPFSDLDRAKMFYADQLGFNLDHEVRISDEHRVIQLTPPGSACSIALQTRPPSGTVDTPPLRRLQLVTPDVDAARALLVERGSGSARSSCSTAVRSAQPVKETRLIIRDSSSSATRRATPGRCSSCLAAISVAFLNGGTRALPLLVAGQSTFGPGLKAVEPVFLHRI
jgi:predicted enzyme related to lactoylglutathione lyase